MLRFAKCQVYDRIDGTTLAYDQWATSGTLSISSTGASLVVTTVNIPNSGMPDNLDFYLFKSTGLTGGFGKNNITWNGFTYTMNSDSSNIWVSTPSS